MDGFLCRIVPLIRSLISIPAGMSNMKFWLFLLFTTAGTLIWNIILVNVGAAVGSSWESIVSYMDVYSNIVYALLVLLFIIAVVIFVKKRLKK